jgi:hypothetical protein
MRPAIEGQRDTLERVCLPFGFDAHSTIDVIYPRHGGMA